MSVVKKTLYILALLLFVLNYHICDFFYYNDEIKDISKWWSLKSNIYAFIVLLIFTASLIGLKGKLRIVLILGIGLSIGNVIDKVFFNVLEYTLFDFLILCCTISYAIYDSVKVRL